ncbi:SDR family oxidoreductase [Sciscionella sediminilitoris]|uniref:SDR family oxidoreductase n=1 Tax=Sciscionella sediminilitoris TaxID=1445613 RepID=UPI0004DFCB68|nr:SDR family oxidoreductase [Sciscionella sp. SE31]
MSYRDKVIVITGASGGVGRAVSRELAVPGHRIALLARGEDGLAGAAGDVRDRGATPMPVTVDVADHVALSATADDIERELGPIDLWINDAFSSVFARSWQIDPDEYRRVTEVSYLGYVYGTLTALARMRPRNHGVIVQVGSALAYRGIPLQSAYCAAKHAVQGFTESVRCELLHEHSKVRITMVQLPGLNTPQFDWLTTRLPKPARPVPPIYQPEIAARAIAHAAHHPGRREYWVGGPTVGTLIGDKFAPGLLDRYLAHSGFEAQQAERAPADSRPNLWRPADSRHNGDPGAHGSFDRFAKPRSWQPVISRHHGAAAGALLAAAGLLWRWRRRSP